MKVILVVVECLRSDHLSCYGYERETTPFLDSVVMSKRGLMWSDFKSIGCETKATFSTVANYAKTVSDNRIHTSYYSGNAVPAGKQMQTSIFDYKSWGPQFPWKPGKRPVADMMIDAFIKAHETRDHFFGILHLRETHAPYQPWGEHKRFIDDATWKTHKKKWGQMTIDELTTLDKCTATQAWDGPDSMMWTREASHMRGCQIATHPAHYIALYDGAIRFLDSRLKGLFDAFPDAEIFVTGDHGEGLGDKGRGFCIHAYGMFPELTRVPCIVRTPVVIAQEMRVMPEKCDHRHMLNTILSRFKIKVPGTLLPWPSADPEVLRRLEGLGYVGRK